MAMPFDKTSTETILLRDENRDKVIVQWTTKPADTTAWYAKGCIFLDTDVATWTSWVYFNKWTNLSCVFELAPVASTGTFTTIDASGDVVIGWTTTLTGGITWKRIDAGITASTGPGAVAVTGAIHEITTTWTGDALTLANWTAGQKLTILYVAEWDGADTAVLTPTTLAGWTTITFSTLGDSCDLTYSATGGWYMTGWTAVIA